MKRSLLIGLVSVSLAATVGAQSSNQSRRPGIGQDAGWVAPTVKSGQPIPANGLLYRVLRIQPGLKEYTQRYDQSRLKFKPTFDADQLVVVELEVENVSDVPMNPTTAGFKLVDADGGVSAFGLYDARLQSGVVAAGVPQDPKAERAEIAPKGKSKMAMVFSLPPNTRAKRLDAYQRTRVVTQGAVVELPGEILAKGELD